MKYTLTLLMALGLIGCGGNTPTPGPNYERLEHVHILQCSDQWTRMDVVYKNNAMGVVDWKLEGHPVPLCATWNSSTWWSITYVKSDGRPQFVNAQMEQ